MHIEIIKDFLGDVISISTHQTERDLSELENGFNFGSVDRHPIILRAFGYCDISYNFNRLIHLFFHTEVVERVRIPEQLCCFFFR